MPLIHEPQMATKHEPMEVVHRKEKIRTKNRRKIYLDRHPEYLTSPDRELSDPLLYDRCIRRFQSAAEREADGRSKGYSGVLEADLYRSEAKIAALKGENEGGEPVVSSSDIVSYIRGENGEVLPEDPDEVPLSKEDGLERWNFEMTLKFLRGEDQDFDYKAVDEDGELDEIESKEEEERWFDDEEPEWVEEEGVETVGGETGIQDF
ncbi:Coiled-coil domain-containing 97 [Hyphodiscus hymeniophilus]|uniref:Coiled-coil domain-containing 97 n=1 Tax=Hyphodiscus hymeniophilus TaxID=353542 RepID=A0A9P6VL93_9HELO|nr:Coiled-coil domain-containing 97 [Hyphodiscus hymeniophilus]